MLQIIINICFKINRLLKSRHDLNMEWYISSEQIQIQRIRMRSKRTSTQHEPISTGRIRLAIPNPNCDRSGLGRRQLSASINIA